MGDGESGQHQLKLQRIVENSDDGRSQRCQVETQANEEKQEGRDEFLHCVPIINQSPAAGFTGH